MRVLYDSFGSLIISSVKALRALWSKWCGVGDAVVYLRRRSVFNTAKHCEFGGAPTTKFRRVEVSCTLSKGRLKAEPSLLVGSRLNLNI